MTNNRAPSYIHTGLVYPSGQAHAGRGALGEGLRPLLGGPGEGAAADCAAAGAGPVAAGRCAQADKLSPTGGESLVAESAMGAQAANHGRNTAAAQDLHQAAGAIIAPRGMANGYIVAGAYATILF